MPKPKRNDPTKSETTPDKKYDHPWKVALVIILKELLELIHRQLHDDIDWDAEIIDAEKELISILEELKVVDQFADNYAISTRND